MIISRTFSIYHVLMRRGLRKRANPGVGYHITEFENKAADEMQNNPEGFGDFESDLINVHKSHKQYEYENQRQANRIRQSIVKSKYFRDSKLPNFLTYAEKEQIRLLHSMDSEHWSVDALAESFPANCEVIHKILKANWKPLSAKRILHHDVGVSKNWVLFNKGEFDKLPNELICHLQKFSARQIEHFQTPTSTQNTPPNTERKVMTNEFSSILASQKREQRGQVQKEASIKKNSSPNNFEEDTFLLDKVVNKKYFRIQELKKANSEMTNESEFLDRKHSANSQPSNTGIAGDLATTFSQKFTLNEVEISDEDKKRFEMFTVKDHIHIPRKILQRGAIYRIEDSYYDGDGEFLYRVPGMKAE